MAPYYTNIRFACPVCLGRGNFRTYETDLHYWALFDEFFLLQGTPYLTSACQNGSFLELEGINHKYAYIQEPVLPHLAKSDDLVLHVIARMTGNVDHALRLSGIGGRGATIEIGLDQSPSQSDP